MKKSVVIGVAIRFRADGSGIAVVTLENGDVVSLTAKQAAQYVELTKASASMLVGATIEYELFAKGDKLFDGSDYEEKEGLKLMKNFDITLNSHVANFLYAIKHGAPVMC